MHLLDETLANISPVTKREACNNIFPCLPHDEDFGELKNILARYLCATGLEVPTKPKKITIITCSDHGVAEMGVSAYPKETTLHMTRAYLDAKGGVANAMSNFIHSKLLVADLGIMVDTSDIKGLLDRKIAYGTKNCAKGPAMTREEAIKAIEVGIQFADEYAKKGYKCFLPGEMGIANTTSSAAIVAVLCDLKPEEATGRGTNISDERLRLKIGVVREVLAKNMPNKNDGLDILAKVGGFELGAIVGIIVGAAKNHAFTVLDGFNTGAAALIADRLSPHVKDYLMGSHLAAEKAHKKILEKLNIPFYMDLDFRLGEATGSSITVNLLDLAVLLAEKLSFQTLNTSFASLPPAHAEEIGDIFSFLQKVTLEELDKKSEEKCQFRLDNLIKPIYSMGRLEKIAVKLAGITQNPFPPTDSKSLMLIFASKIEETKEKIIHAGALHAHSQVFVFPQCKDYQEVFQQSYFSVKNFLTQEKITLFAPALAEEKDDQKSILASLKPFTEKKGKDFFSALAKDNSISPVLRAKIFAYAASIVAGAKAHALVILDDEVSEKIAQELSELLPSLEAYLLHVQPHLLNLRLKLNGGTLASLGLKIVDASLHVLNDMKTFAEAGVAIATDGAGKGRQVDR